MKKMIKMIAKVLLTLVMLYLILYSNIEILCEFESFMWPANLRGAELTDLILFVLDKSITCGAYWAVIACCYQTHKATAIVHLLCVFVYLVMLLVDADLVTIMFCMGVFSIQGVFIPLTYLSDLKVVKRDNVGE